ncbi:hypothetical protein [Embleya sp. NPDC020630]|uniref:hypothetical protein n=1 Tax=Embleya sp. NPDC020630 TaxID=3363979 RepID=UPI0037A04A93
MSDLEPLDEPAFSNGEELAWWINANCRACVHDEPARRGDYTNGCGLLVLVYAAFTPLEFLAGPDRTPADRWVCVERRTEDDGPDPTPRPVPDPPGQGVLLPREPYTGHRVLTVLPEHTGATA